MSSSRRKILWTAASIPVIAASGVGVHPAKSAEVARHRVVFQINSNDVAPMKHAVSNSINLVRYYESSGESIEVEIVAYGFGIYMFRTDKSPILGILNYIREHIENITFTVCGNSLSIMASQEGHPIPLIDGTKIVPFGIVRLVQLQESGWSYIRP